MAGPRAAWTREFNSKYLQHGAALSPDGKTLVFGDEDGLMFRDLRTGKAEVGIKAVKDHLYVGPKFSADGRFILVIHYDNRNLGKGVRLVILDAKTRGTIATKDIDGPANLSDISHDGEWVVVAAKKDNYPVWHLFNCRKRILSAFRETYPHNRLRCISFSPDGIHLAIGLLNGKVQIWDIRTKRQVLSWTACTPADPKQSARVGAVEFSPDGKLLATASSMGDVHLWDLMNAE